jgi:two-component system C4-dicarboxylate transport sensor histidine kinase DctB
MALSLDPHPERCRALGDHRHPALPDRDPTPAEPQPHAWLTQTHDIAETGWSVSILAPRTLIDRPVRTVVAIGGATLLVVMLLLGLMMQRRRHYLERIAFEAKARRELEGRVAERTSDLEGLNRRLKQEVLEREHGPAGVGPRPG